MARNRTRHLEPYITLWTQFHAYVLGSVIGVKWGKITPYTGMGNKDLGKIVREYLEYAAGNDEWRKRSILDAMRNKSSASIKDDARYAFPSLFPRRRKALSLAIPKEIEEDVNFNPELIHEWQQRVKIIKKEITMNENVLEQVSETAESTTAKGNNRVTVNFYLPPNVDPSTITLENYKELTGKRFRMTKDQAKVRGLTREEAFAESKSLAMQQLGDDE